MKELIDVVRLQLIPDEHLKLEVPIASPEAVVKRFGEELRKSSREVLAALFLSTKNKVLAIHLVSMGTVNNSLAVPAEVIKPALLCNAAGVILLHNHPSGDPTPSYEDMMTTERMEQACTLMGLDFRDHIIMGEDSEKYYSFAEDQELKQRMEKKRVTSKRSKGR